MHAVNLLPRKLAAPRHSLQPLALVGAAAVPLIAIVLVAVGYSSAHSTVASEKAKFAALEAQVAALGGATSVTRQTATESASAAATAAKWDALISERTSRRAELDLVLEQELPWDTMLRNVARLLPSDVWLTQLSFASPVTFGASTTTTSSSSTSTANDVTISGYGESETSIALLLVRLQLLPTLSNVELGTTSNTTAGSKKVVQFTVTAAIQAPVVPALATTPAITTTPTTTTTTTTTTG